MRNSSRGHVLLAALLFITLASVAVGALYLWQTRPSQPLTPSSTVTAPTESETTANQPTATTHAADETVNWKTYTDTQYGFSFKYPKEAQVEVLTGEIFKDKPLVHEVRVSYLGPDNRPQTEVSDGYFFTVDLIRKQPDRNLRAIIADEIKACLEVGDLLSLQTPEEFYAKSGVWRYSCQGLGISVHDLMLDPTENGFYYNLITHVANPKETKEKIYQKTVDQILATFKFLD